MSPRQAKRLRMARRVTLENGEPGAALYKRVALAEGVVKLRWPRLNHRERGRVTSYLLRGRLYSAALAAQGLNVKTGRKEA